MLEQGLLLAVRLWGRLPAERAAQCALLPTVAPAPPADFFTRTTGDSAHAAAGAAAAFFSRAHLQARASVSRAHLQACAFLSRPICRRVSVSVAPICRRVPCVRHKHAHVHGMSDGGRAGIQHGRPLLHPSLYMLASARLGLQKERAVTRAAASLQLQHVAL